MNQPQQTITNIDRIAVIVSTIDYFDSCLDNLLSDIPVKELLRDINNFITELDYHIEHLEEG